MILSPDELAELTVRRGDQVVLLQPGEVQTLLRFAGRMLQAEA